MLKEKEQNWHDFIMLLKKAFAEGKEDELLTLLMTVDERETLGLRVKIVDELIEKKRPQREIQQKLNTSAATITRGSNMLKMMDGKFIEWLNETRETK